MSEPQTETDSEPTPSLVEAWDHRPMPNQTNPNYRELVYAESKETIAILDCVTVEDADLIAAAGYAAQEAREIGYDPQKAVEALPKLIEATDSGGPVSDALCALKQAADFIEYETDSKLGAARLHRLADKAAESVGLEIKVASDSAEGSGE